MEFVRWIGRFTVMKKRVHESWMDLMPGYDKQSTNYLQAVATRNADTQRAANLAGVPPDLLNPDDDQVFEEWKASAARRHSQNFPLGESLFSWVFVVASDLAEHQRESD